MNLITVKKTIVRTSVRLLQDSFAKLSPSQPTPAKLGWDSLIISLILNPAPPNSSFEVLESYI